jgi:hypothetical protein
MPEISAAERREQTAADWKAAPAFARKAVGFSIICGVLWAIRIVLNIYATHGRVEGRSVVLTVPVLLLFFGFGVSALARNRWAFILLAVGTCLSLVGPLLWALQLLSFLAAGKVATNPLVLPFAVLSGAQIVAGIALIVCLFWPSTLRRVWIRDGDPPEPPAVQPPV